jgi:hypothetical protein
MSAVVWGFEHPGSQRPSDPPGALGFVRRWRTSIAAPHLIPVHTRPPPPAKKNNWAAPQPAPRKRTRSHGAIVFPSNTDAFSRSASTHVLCHPTGFPLGAATGYGAAAVRPVKTRMAPSDTITRSPHARSGQQPPRLADDRWCDENPAQGGGEASGTHPSTKASSAAPRPCAAGCRTACAPRRFAALLAADCMLWPDACCVRRHLCCSGLYGFDIGS